MPRGAAALAGQRSGPTHFRDATRRRLLEYLRFPYWTEAERAKVGPAAGALARAGEVLDTLASASLAMYRQLWYEERALEPKRHVELDRLPRETWHNDRLVLQWRCLPGIDDRLAPLRDALQGWATRWGLDVEWALDHALETLAVWCEVPQALERRAWASPPTITISPVHEYRVPWWDGTASYSAFKKRAKETVLGKLEEDLRRTEAEMREHGWLLEPGRHGKNSFIWTVRAHVLEEPASKIADEAEVDRKTVRQSVSRLLAFVDLRPRPRRRGRPEGARDRHRVIGHRR